MTPLPLRAAALLAALLATTVHAARPQYQIVDLGVVGQATASQAFGVSPDGSIAVGRALGAHANPAYAWTSATGMSALPNLKGRKYAQANGANDAGVVVGTSMTTLFGSGALPVVWQGGKVRQFALPAGESVGRAWSINASDVAVGSIGSDVTERAAIFRHSGTQVIDAVTANGSYMAYAFGINDAGLVAGSGIDPNDAAVNVGLVYDIDTGTLTSVGALPGDNSALVFGVGGGGHVVGSSMMYQGAGRPFVWTAAGGIVEIPLPPKTSEGAAYGVNRRGWAVGNGGGLYSVPFLYIDGTTYPLYTLLPANSGWDLNKNTSSSAQAITDGGTIVGTGVHNGETHGYMMFLVAAAGADAP